MKKTYGDGAPLFSQSHKFRDRRWKRFVPMFVWHLIGHPRMSDGALTGDFTSRYK